MVFRLQIPRIKDNCDSLWKELYGVFGRLHISPDLHWLLVSNRARWDFACKGKCSLSCQNFWNLMYFFCLITLKLSVLGSVCLFWEKTKTTQYAEAAAGRSCDIFEALRLAVLLICPLICLPVKVFSNPTPALDSAHRERIAKSGKFGLIGLDGWFWVKSDPWNPGKRALSFFFARSWFLFRAAYMSPLVGLPWLTV